MKKQKDMVRFSLNVSPELADKIEQMSEKAHTTKSDILRKAIFLMDIAIDSKEHGNKLAVVNPQGQKVSEIIGV